MRFLAVALLLVLGGLSGFAILGPPNLLRGQAGRKPSPSRSPAPTPSPRRCAAPTPSPTATPSPSGPPLVAFPTPVWVNPADGANFRTEPRLSAPRLGTLPRGTAGQADQQAIDRSGAVWYRVTAAGRTGWIRGDLLVLEPIILYNAYSFGMRGWSLILVRDSSSGGVGDGSYAEFQSGSVDRPYWFIIVQTAPSGAALPPPMPFLIGAEHPELYERSQPVGVWTYTTTERVVRASFDTCTFRDMAKVVGGWPYLTTVQVVTPSRAYQFLFVTEGPDSPLVQQVLDSVVLG